MNSREMETDKLRAAVPEASPRVTNEIGRKERHPFDTKWLPDFA
jgi:hypothetical protein